MPTIDQKTRQILKLHLQAIGRKGGRSRSGPKVAAARANIRAYNARRRVRA